jgi:hypothetical protein
MEFMKSNNTDLSKLKFVVIDGTPSCACNNKGFITLLKESENILAFVHCHCLITLKIYLAV